MNGSIDENIKENIKENEMPETGCQLQNETENKELTCDPATESESTPVCESVQTCDPTPTCESEPIPAPICDPAPPVIDTAIFDEITAKLKSLETLFNKRLTYDEGKEKILDKLHSELQNYKSDLYFKLTKPIFLDIVVVLDDIRKIRENLDLEKQNECDSTLDSISESLIYLLDKYEVLPFSSEEDSKFDAVKQRMIRTKDTDEDAQIATIAQSVFTGFMYKDQLVSPEKVVVYKKTKKAEES
jgi:molecular chaperone GrpE